MGDTRSSFVVAGSVLFVALLLVLVDNPSLLTAQVAAWHATADPLPSATRSCLRNVPLNITEPFTAGAGVAADDRVTAVVRSRSFLLKCSKEPSQTSYSFHEVPEGNPALAPMTWPGQGGLGSYGFGFVRDDVVAVEVETVHGLVLDADVRGGTFLVDLTGVRGDELAGVVYQGRDAGGAVLFEGRVIPRAG